MIRQAYTRWSAALLGGAMLMQVGCPLGYRPRQLEIGFWNELGRLLANLPITATELATQAI